MSVGDFILIFLAVVATVPIVWLLLEIIVALLPQSNRDKVQKGKRPRCAILVPAHNEQAGIAATIERLQSELQAGDHIVVIADNCSDRTAEVARIRAVEVIERCDPDRRGKGYALDFGLKHLTVDPPEVVVLVDADTRVFPGSLEPLVRAAAEHQCPAQGIFVDAPSARSPREQWSAFALTFKNHVRPLGLYRLGLPCLLTGSGMAFPWWVIQKAELGTGNIVEDMQLGIDLAIAGYAPRFCPESRFESNDAPSEAATTKRRTRWEHGHVRTLLTQAPRLLLAGLVQLRPRLIALAMELAVPPLSLLLLIQTALLVVSIIWAMLGGSFIPAIVLTSGAIAGAIGVFVARNKFARDLISLKTMVFLPIYVLWKLPIYLKLLLAPERIWVRTDREPSP
jgi:cellulose synthase/poly-beta-1,6-N-acetylglucosamine synthase-like glycosyltransferase